MKVIVGKALVNTDNCSVLDTKVLTDWAPNSEAKRHVLRNASMPICDFPTKDALDNAMDAIQEGVRLHLAWIELDAVDGHCINGCPQAWACRLPKYVADENSGS